MPGKADSASRLRESYEVEQPWIVYRIGFTRDAWWPFWNSTRVLGRALWELECAVCGRRERVWVRIPRFGPVPKPKGGRHPERIRFMLDHLHRDRPHPMSWARPLLNPAAHGGGIDLGLLAMRLEADLNEAQNGSSTTTEGGDTQ